MNTFISLNSKYDQVRIQIPGREKLPPLHKDILLIRGEETRRNLMLGRQNMDSSAFVTIGKKKSPSGQKKTPSGDFRDNLWCTFCRKPRHH